MGAATMLRLLGIASIMMTMVNLQSPVAQCSDNSPLPLYFDNNCNGLVCCKVFGDSLDLNLDFITTQPSTSLNLQIKSASNNDIYTVKSYPSPEPDACSKLENATCPLEAGQTVKYRSSYVVADSFMERTVHLVEHRMVNENNETQTCFVQVIKVKRSGEICGENCNVTD